MFLAIINDTYSEVKAEVNARKEAFQVSLEQLQLTTIISFFRPICPRPYAANIKLFFSRTGVVFKRVIEQTHLEQ